jgi:hypothetical protein
MRCLCARGEIPGPAPALPQPACLPALQVHLRAALAQSRCEIIRLEALEKLAGAREHREARRRQAAAEAAAARQAKAAAVARNSRGSLRAGSVTGVVHSAASLAGSGLAAAGAAAGGLAEGVAAGVASLDVFGLVSRLRGAMDASYIPLGQASEAAH